MEADMRNASQHLIALLLLACLPLLGACGASDGDPRDARAPVGPEGAAMTLDREAASRFARLALGGIEREFPNKLGHVMNDASEVQNPASLHPAFYGSFDWHSSVHGHWMLVRLLKLFPDLPEGNAIREVLGRHLTAANIAAEVAYFAQPNRKSFERTYGWAWLLKLAEELHGWEDGDAKKWASALAPLADALEKRYIDFLPRQTYPIRRGVHPNTAFGIAFGLDYARAAGRAELEKLLVDRARAYYCDDAGYPAAWEPDGDDFFSPSLMEADLMRRVLPRPEFSRWFRRFLPALARGEQRSRLEPAVVADRSDPKIVHLDGLNLSRAWCMKGIASTLGADHPLARTLIGSARAHADATLAHVTSGHYEGEHWLASFAVYLLTDAP